MLSPWILLFENMAIWDVVSCSSHDSRIQLFGTYLALQFMWLSIVAATSLSFVCLKNVLLLSSSLSSSSFVVVFNFLDQMRTMWGSGGASFLVGLFDCSLLTHYHCPFFMYQRHQPVAHCFWILDTIKNTLALRVFSVVSVNDESLCTV